MIFVFFFFKQKTAYVMRISDWSSDVCSSDLLHHVDDARQKPADQLVPKRGSPGCSVQRPFKRCVARVRQVSDCHDARFQSHEQPIGRAAWRERVCQYVSISVVAVTFKTKNKERNNNTVNTHKRKTTTK